FAYAHWLTTIAYRAFESGRAFLGKGVRSQDRSVYTPVQANGEYPWASPEAGAISIVSAVGLLRMQRPPIRPMEVYRRSRRSWYLRRHRYLLSLRANDLHPLKGALAR